MRPSLRLAILALIIPLLAAAPVVRAEDLIVSAAASLTNAFRDIGAAFERQNPGVRVTFNFAASGPLLQQIDAGAPADVLASADEETIDKAAERKLIVPASRRDFATNRLVLIQPRGAAALRSLGDLRAEGVKRIAVGNPASVPIGRYTRDVLQPEGLWDALASRFILADSVRQVLDYVTRGEVDAGFVYSTDAAIAGDKVVVALVVRTPRPVRYPIAVVAASRRKPLAEAFIALVTSEVGQATLDKHGFGKP